MPQEFRTRTQLKFEMVEGYRDRQGFAIIASMRDAYGNLLEYECTKQFTTPQGAMDAFTGWMRRMSVEDQAE